MSSQVAGKRVHTLKLSLPTHMHQMPPSLPDTSSFTIQIALQKLMIRAPLVLKVICTLVENTLHRS